MHFGWDEICCEVYEHDPQDPANSEGWEFKFEYPNGVKVFQSDRGHVALETEARDATHADQKFLICKHYRRP